MNDPDLSIDLIYRQVFAVMDFGPIQSFGSFVFVPFDPAAGTDSFRGYELLSQLQMGWPIGMPADGTFFITGTVQSTADESDDVLEVVAIVDTAQAGTCDVTILNS